MAISKIEDDGIRCRLLHAHGLTSEAMDLLLPVRRAAERHRLVVYLGSRIRTGQAEEASTRLVASCLSHLGP